MHKEEAKLVKEFSRFAHHYDDYSVIQAEVAKTLVAEVPNIKYNTIIDIGCGSGGVYRNIKSNNFLFEKFIAVDLSQEMLSLHPSLGKIVKVCADFNKSKMYKTFSYDRNNILLSSSALQWSEDLDFTLLEFSKRFEKAHFAIFTSNTFKTLHKIAKLKSPIYSSLQLQEIVQKYYSATFEIQQYRLYFDSVRDMFSYIKKSGVSGGEKKLSYRQAKHLMKVYPLNYLEFEVLFVKGENKVKLDA